MTELKDLDLDLATLQRPDGTPPSTRMADAVQARAVTIRALQYDRQLRDPKRSVLKGMVDGNPPYDAQKLRQAGRADECNINLRLAPAFLGAAQGMLYDIFSEAETYTTITLDKYELRRNDSADGNFDPDASYAQAEDWSRVISDEFQTMQTVDDEEFDWNNQQSQGQSVFYGCGPMHFADELDWRPISHEAKMLVLSEVARSNVNRWDWAAIVHECSPDEVYARIANASAAQRRGWNVPATREAIMNAHPLTKTGVAYQTWSWHQDALKNGSFFYADQSKRLTLVHFLYREFPEADEESGRISEVIFELDPQAGNEGSLAYLYQGLRRYDSWRNVVHPIYWKHDLNGYHHSVNGLGLEMYGALEYLNRLYCRNLDDAMAPKFMFKPTTASASEAGNVVMHGRYMKLPVNWDVVQQQIQPFMQEGMAMTREVRDLLSTNLSQYRASALQKQQGNPVTARQVDYDASEQAKMGKTQLARIYEQYDALYAEKYRRATNPNLTASVRGGKAALAMWKRCERRGVPKWALTRIASVRATRVIGQGSQYLRQQALEFLIGLLSTLPETGRFNLIRDVIASRAGQAHVDRYAPMPNQLSSDEAAQKAEAMLQVSSMKTGVPPVPVPTQNPLIFGQIFVQAGEAAIQAVQQGGDPNETASFLQLLVPSAAYHIQRLGQDKSRMTAAKDLSQRLKAIQQFMSQLIENLQQQAQESAQAQQQAAQIQAGQDPETQIGLAKVQANFQRDIAKLQAQMYLKHARQNADLALKQGKQQADIALNAHQTAIDSAIADAEAAAGIHRNNLLARSKARNGNGSDNGD